MAAPLITSLSPPSATAGGAGFTLTVNGTGFMPGSVVFWNSTALTTTYVNANQLTATVPASLIAVGTVNPAIVTVFNAGDCNPLSFGVLFGITGCPQIKIVKVALTPANADPFTQAHGLGVAPLAVTFEMTSDGAFWLQNPTKYDATNIYLVPSAGGITGNAVMVTPC